LGKRGDISFAGDTRAAKLLIDSGLRNETRWASALAGRMWARQIAS
jgi:hypothetical protein